MAHSLILGITESGKTTLAKRFVPHFKRQQLGVIVLDPMASPDWGADFVTADPVEFLRVFWASKRCVAMIDESGETVGQYEREMHKTATKGRHWGHACMYLAQRAMQIAPLVRDQCTHLFLFCSSTADGKLHAAEWNEPQLEQCAKLERGEYFHAQRYNALQRGHLFKNTYGVKANEPQAIADNRRNSAGGVRSIVASEEESDASADPGTAASAVPSASADADPGKTAGSES